MKPTITIFTPTYNRARTLTRLYESLLCQTSTNFEWLIVDDGSTDNTEDIITQFQTNSSFAVVYYRQLNYGKHIAINRGLDIAKGELFFIVDSDDWLRDNAVERIVFHYTQIKGNNQFAGVCGLKVFENGEKVGGECDFGVLECNSLDFRYKFHVKGDMAEVFITDILRKFRFPTTLGEKFCPEALVWNKIAIHYKLRYFYEKIYFCEYLPDGLTAKITKLRIKNPINSCTYYVELSKMPISLFSKLKAQINFWRFSFYLQESFSQKLNQIGIGALIVYPIGLIMYSLIDKKNESFTYHQ